MPSPDVSNYVDLTLYDADPESIYDAGLVAAQSKLPEWQPRADHTETVLLEALAVEVSELIYAVNRIPGGVVETLLRLYGLDRDPGRQPAATVTLTLADNLGHTIPAGTRFLLTTEDLTEPVELALDADVVIAPGATTGTGAVTSIGAPTGAANGTPAGTRLGTLDAVPYLDTATLATPISGGTDPEDGEAFLDRGIVRLQRLVTTLVRADHFTAAALEQPYVARAGTVDLTTPDAIATPAAPTLTTSTTGGTLAAGTYTYRVSAVNAAGETLASSSTSITTTGSTSTVTVAWSAPNVPSGVGPITNYRVYGRSGTLTRRVEVGSGVLSWVDTGSAAAGAALPTANTTAPAAGTVPGHVTTAVSGPGGVLLSAADKAELDTLLTSSSLANLNVHVTDATITTVNVAVTIVLKPDAVQADTIAAVEAAIRDYMNPDTWEWAGTVYRFELIALVDGVAGVERVTAVTLNGGTSNVTIAGIGPLANAGTVNVTITT